MTSHLQLSSNSKGTDTTATKRQINRCNYQYVFLHHLPHKIDKTKAQHTSGEKNNHKAPRTRNYKLLHNYIPRTRNYKILHNSGKQNGGGKLGRLRRVDQNNTTAPTTDPQTRANRRSTTTKLTQIWNYRTKGNARDKGNQPRQPGNEEKREEKSKSNGGIARNHHESPPLRRRSSSLPRPYRNRMTKRKGTTPTPKFKQDKRTTGRARLRVQTKKNRTR